MQPMSAANAAGDRDLRSDGERAPSALINVARVRPVEQPSRLTKLCDTAAFVLLLLAAGTLLFRPSDLLPVLNGAPIYEVLIIACLAASAPALLQHLSGPSIRRNGVMAVLTLFVPAVVLSHLASANTWNARISGSEMLKACTFSLLIVTLVDTPAKMRRLFVAVIAAVIAVTGLSILHYHGVLHVPALASIEQRSVEGEETILRLCGIGVFNDPNDFSLLLVIAMTLCAYGIAEADRVIVRVILAAPLCLFAYGLLLTQSRGGMIAGCVSLLAFLQARTGWRNTLLLVALALPPIVLLASGRQVSLNLDDPDDTFQTRLQLWNDAFGVFWHAPIFGIGTGQLVERFGAVAHNSYVQAFTEMGLFGGTVFAGAFFLALSGLWRARPTDRLVSRMRPCMLAIVAGYAAGLFSLSRCYTVPTQMVLALAAAYLAIGGFPGLRPLDWRAMRSLAFVSATLIFGTFVFLRVMLR